MWSISQIVGLERRHTGIVIPVYLPPALDVRRGQELLRETVSAYLEHVADPKSICLSVDGEQYGADRAAEVAGAAGASLVVAPVNRGKLQAARIGAARLLENPDLRYLAVIDQDGDHFSNELRNFVWAAEHIGRHRGDDRVMVLGRRISRHYPMGFLRGELEELADRVLLDALSYHAVVSGEPLKLEYAATFDEFPDFHSGYKLFSRGVAEAVFRCEPDLSGATEDGYYRHGCESVMTVEAALAGAYLGVVNRSTLYEQPITTFGLMKLDRLVADKMIWPCRRLGVPARFVAQWLDNYTPRLLLNTLAPQGKDELARIKRLVLEGLDAGVAAEEARAPLAPRFV